MITARYRKDYTGEFIITNTSWENGKKQTQREWIPNPIENHHISGRAACIGSVDDGEYFDFTVLQKHKGGLLGSKKLQTYGVGEIAKYMRLDFAIEKDELLLNELITSNYVKDNIVYTTPRQCIKHPGVFYTIPHNPQMIKQVVAAYLAAFDGHTEIFLLGYHAESDFGHIDWIGQMERLIAAYPATKFYHVAFPPQTPDAWKSYNNLIQMTHREFVYHADV